MRSLFALLLLAGFARAQLAGRLVSPAGQPLPAARITVAGQPPLQLQAGARGEWRADLPPGRYELVFTAPGFAERRLTADAPATLGDVTLEPPVPEVIRYQPVVDPGRTPQADFITRRQLTTLPVNRRSYLHLAVLTPGVASVNDYVGLTDAPLVQAPHSGLSFGGNNGRGNVFWLDGGENDTNTGGVRASISQEAVAEFQVERANYSAEFGGGLGGIVNVVSQAGGDRFHTTLFGFLRQRSFQARNAFDPAGDASFTRSQGGFTFSGPLRRSRTAFFAAFERLDRHESAFVPVGRERGAFWRLRDTQQDLANFFNASPNPRLQTLGALTELLLNTANFPATIALFNANRGTFPFAESAQTGSLRLDHRFTDNNVFFLRFNAGTGQSDNAQVEGLNGYSRGVLSASSDQTLLLDHSWVLSPRLVSQTRLLLNRYRFAAGNRDSVGPSLDISGYGFFGKDWTLPSSYGEWHGQLRQTFFFASGVHSLRFGAGLNPVRAGVHAGISSGGRFGFGEYLPLGSLYEFLGGGPAISAEIRAALQGQNRLLRALDIPLKAIQAFNLGIPAYYIQGFGNPRWNGWFHRANAFVNDVVRLHPRLTLNAGLRAEFEGAPVELGRDDRHWLAPRVGLAWDFTGRQRGVLRAGYGLYFLPHQSQLAAATALQTDASYTQVIVPLSGVPGLLYPATGQPLRSSDIYSSLLERGILGRRAITAADLAPFGIRLDSTFPNRILFARPRHFVHAYSQQSSIELERALGANALSVSYLFTRGLHLPRLRDFNAAPGPRLPDGSPPRVDPSISQLVAYESAANSFYHAGTAQFTRRFARRLQANAHYTFSKSIDEVTDINFLPDDSRQPRLERALSTFHQQHRFVVSAIASLPAGWTFAPLLIASSGRPFNVVTGEDFNSLRPAGAGRNIGRGPAFFTADARLAKRFAFGRDGQRAVEFIAEGFNLLNRTNFRRINNVAGQVTAAALPRPLTGLRGDPTDPFSFVSSFDPRQLQLALKLHF